MVPVSIPIAFDYEGKRIEGIFKPVHGAGARVWHLMINNYYRGQLTYNESTDTWSYHGNAFGNMASPFGEYVTAWIQ